MDADSGTVTLQYLYFKILLYHLGCEDIIIDNLTADNLITVLNWSAEPHGSKWVHRQAMAFLTEEFMQVSLVSDLCFFIWLGVYV